MARQRAFPAVVAVVAMAVVAACGTEVPPSAPGTSSPTPVATIAGPSPSTGTASPRVASPSAASPTAAPAATPGSSPAAAWPYRTSWEITDVLFPPDGRVIVLERDWEASLSRVVTLEEDGAVAPGWPWSPEPTGNPVAVAALGPEGSVYVAVRGQTGDPIEWSWQLHRVTAAGQEAAGFPVPLPAVPFCRLDVSRGIAYASCEDEDEGTDQVVATVTAIGQDGSIIPGWPVTGLGTVLAVMPAGEVILDAPQEDRRSLAVVAPDGRVLPGWPRRIPPGVVTVDARGWIRITNQQYGEDACPDPIRTVYDVRKPDGTRPAGWPLSIRGWASDAEVARDGTMYIVTESGRARAYSRRGELIAGWPVRNVGVTYGCQGGSRAWSAGGDGIVVVGDGEAVMLSFDGELVSGWPVRLPHALAIVCPGCTPGSSEPVRPVVGARRIYVAGYRRDRPRIMVIDRDGSMPADAQLRIGRAGDEIMTLTMAPTGRVWAVLAGQGTGEESTLPGSLYLVGQDTAP